MMVSKIASCWRRLDFSLGMTQTWGTPPTKATTFDTAELMFSKQPWNISVKIVTSRVVFCYASPFCTGSYSQMLDTFLVGGLEHFFPYIGNNHHNWLPYFSEVLKPPTRFRYHICIDFLMQGSNSGYHPDTQILFACLLLNLTAGARWDFTKGRSLR